MEHQNQERINESTPINKGDLNIENEKRKNVDIEEALEYTGFGKYNIYLILLCGLCLFAANIESYSIGYVLPAAECDLKLHNSKKGILTSSTFFGILTSSVFWGYISDRKGRRNLLLVTLALTFLTSALASFSLSFWGFTILRFLTGICISAPSSIIFAYFGEFQSATNRSKGIALISVFISLVLILLPCLGWLILPATININIFGLLELNSWRLFMFISAVPNLASAVLFLLFPESPKYLYHNGQIEEAYDVLKSMFVCNTGLSEKDFPIESLDDSVLYDKDEVIKTNMLTEMWLQVAAIFKPPNLKYTLVGCGLQAGVYAVSVGLFLWYPLIINQLSKGNKEEPLTVCQALALSMNKTHDSGCRTNLSDDIFIQNIIIGFAFLIGYLSWGSFVKWLGNRNFFVACMLISSMCTILLYFVTQKLLIDIIFVIILMLPGICIALICAIVVDVIPSNLCGMAICVTLTGGRLGSILSSSVVGFLLEWNCTGTFLIYAGALIFCLVLAFSFPRKSS